MAAFGTVIDMADFILLLDNGACMENPLSRYNTDAQRIHITDHVASVANLFRSHHQYKKKQ